MNLHLVLGATRHDSRILKETASLDRSGMFEQVLVFGLTDEMHTVERCEGGRTTVEFALQTRKLPRNLVGQAVKYAEWRSKVLGACRDLPVEVVHCHDLHPLPIAVRIKELTGARLIYDAHELETERAGLHGVRRRLAQRTERRMMRHVDAIVTVSPSIVEWYRNRYPEAEIVLVRNVPERVVDTGTVEPLRARLGVPGEAVLFISIGGFFRGRGIDRTLKAFADPAVTHHVVFMGYGPLADQIDAAAARCPRIHRIPPVASGDVTRCAGGADVGLSLIDEICLSYRFCLPNKLFESLVAGVPVLCSDLPDQAGLIRQYEAGWTVGASVESLVRRLTEISIDETRRIRSGLPGRVAELGWEHEAERLVDLYRRLRGRS